jgi:peptidoglycan/xylan/chitin deacetylase (PgdA/CDA1 family)
VSLRVPLWPLFLIFGLSLLSCGIVRLGGPVGVTQPAAIIFVTTTPQPEPVLHESMRSLPLPTPEIAPVVVGNANEMGKVMVLEYHRLGPEQRYQRSPANFRADLQQLYELGYYPVNFIDMVRGLRNVPAGKKPIVLTFDDSDISQFEVLPDHTINADSAVGIILNFHNQHPADWPVRATFFVLGNDNNHYFTIFGQPEWAKAKVQFLVENGMEVGSHTVSHVNLATITAERIGWELAVSQYVLEDLVPGYQVESLAVPYGEFPYTSDFLKAGQWGNFKYTYAANAAAWGGPGVSPFDPAFNPYHVSRLEVTPESLTQWLAYFARNPQQYYIADGDPQRLTTPDSTQTAAK